MGLFEEYRAASIELIFSYFGPLCTAMRAFIASTTKCLWLNNNMWYSKQAYISLCLGLEKELRKICPHKLINNNDVESSLKKIQKCVSILDF